MFLLVTAYVMVFQPEASEPGQMLKEKGSDENLQLTRPEPTSNGKPGLRIRGSYILLWQLICLRPVQLACIVLLTSRIGFAATDATGILKVSSTTYRMWLSTPTR